MTHKKLSKPLKFKSFITRNVHHTKAELPQEGILFCTQFYSLRIFIDIRRLFYRKNTTHSLDSFETRSKSVGLICNPSYFFNVHVCRCTISSKRAPIRDISPCGERSEIFHCTCKQFMWQFFGCKAT